ncbi:hypothetical protein C0989_004565, partial [Termitomyces sp. Mn162]
LSTLYVAITTHGITIHSPNCKGKSKAQEEEKGEEMAIDPADILLSADNDNDDDGKLEDYPNNHVGESPSTTE